MTECYFDIQLDNAALHPERVHLLSQSDSLGASFSARSFDMVRSGVLPPLSNSYA